MSLNYLNAFFKRSSPSFTVSSGQPMFIRKKPSPSGPKSMPLFKPIFASWSSFSGFARGITLLPGNQARVRRSFPGVSSLSRVILPGGTDRQTGCFFEVANHFVEPSISELVGRLQGDMSEDIT